MNSVTSKRGPRYGILGYLPEPDSPESILWNLNQTQSPLLRLPAEIRNRIYELVLGGARIHVLFAPWTHKRSENHNHETTPGGFHCIVLPRKINPWQNERVKPDAISRGMKLLAPVCRQLYHETALLPYQLNVWSFHNAYVMQRYIMKEKRLPLLQRRSIRTLAVCGIPTNSNLSRKMRKYMGGLETIYWWDANQKKMKKEIVGEDE